MPPASDGRDIGQKDGEGHNLPTEFLDDTDDAHALIFGLWRGFRTLRPTPQYQESKRNPHYFMLGYIGGKLLQLAVGGGAAYVAAGSV